MTKICIFTVGIVEMLTALVSLVDKRSAINKYHAEGRWEIHLTIQAVEYLHVCHTIYEFKMFTLAEITLCL